MLEFNDVSAAYKGAGANVLKGVNGVIDEGDFLCVLGRNGVGKTTLTRTIVGLMASSGGSLKLKGEEIGHLPANQRVRHGIGYVPQGRGILPRLTVYENILMGTFARPDRKRVVPEAVLELFPYLSENMQRTAGLLSGGQQQQVALARALASEPGILILDEPTEGIQPNLCDFIRETCTDLNTKWGITVILVEQNLEFARNSGRKFWIMDHGTVMERGAMTDLTEDIIDQYLTV